MKKIFLLFVLVIGVSAAFSQTLFTYGSSSVDKAEFIRAYNKNKTPVDNKEKALREYLDLYIKFKLKVNAAKELKLDTLPQLLFDAQSFRTQIEESYLSNEKEIDALIDEAISRSLKDLHVLHFFAPVATANTEDSIKAYRSINNIYTALASGKTDHDKLTEAEQGIVKQSDIGFVTVFTLPYEYENVIYGLKTGQASKPYRSKKGWHVFKVIDERKAVGKWKIAQILFAVPPDQSVNKAAIEKKADSVYQELQKGADFATMARLFSDDKITYGTGGELPEFGSGKFDPSFEKEIFKLTGDGEISRPFLSSYGYHIVKRIAQSPVLTDRNDNTLLFEMKQKIQQDSRVNSARESFTREIAKQVSFKKTGAVADADLFRYADTVIKNITSAITNNTSAYPISNKVIYTFGKAKITGKEWLDFISSYKGSGEFYQGESNAALLQKFVSSITLDYYKKNLEDYNADFRYQMEEFKDGNVLFEIMERNIWGRAAGDTEALTKYYNEHKNKYTWAASADILLFNCPNKAVAEAARDALKNGKNWKRIAEESNNTLQADSGRFELSQIPIVIDPSSPAGFITDIMVNADGTAGFAKVIRPYAANTLRNFDEAKGLVINDYQNILEEKWIADLKKKYPIKINENIFQSLLK
jgi:peptidyl-prolyl cis-trans isomerase SurA